MSRTLVAGIGNIFFGDDAFGVEVAEHLAGRAMPEGVRVEDFGIRSVHAIKVLDPERTDLPFGASIRSSCRSWRRKPRKPTT